MPRVWSLCDDGTLCPRPLPELKKLRGEHDRYTNVEIESGWTGYLSRSDGMQLEIVAEIESGTARLFGLEVRRSPDAREVTRIYYDSEAETINLDLGSSTLGTPAFTEAHRQTSYPLKEGERLKLHVFVDHSVVEVLVDDREAFSTRVFPTLESSTAIDLFAEGGVAKAEQVDVWQMNDAAPLKRLESDGAMYESGHPVRFGRSLDDYRT